MQYHGLSASFVVSVLVPGSSSIPHPFWAYPLVRKYFFFLIYVVIVLFETNINIISFFTDRRTNSGLQGTMGNRGLQPVLKECVGVCEVFIFLIFKYNF